MGVSGSVTLDSNVQNSLAWTNSTLFTGGFHIERSQDDGSTWDTLDIVDSGTFMLVDSGVDNETYDYLYRISALPRGTGVAGFQAIESIFPSSPGLQIPGSYGPFLWLQPTSIGGSGGRCDFVPEWEDTEGSRLFIQGTEANTPVRGVGYNTAASGNGGNCGGSGVGGSGLNGYGYVIFDGISDELTCPQIGIASGTMFFVVRPNDLTANIERNLIAHASGAGNSGGLAFCPNGGTAGLSIWDGSAWQNLISAANLTTNDFQVITVDIDEVGSVRSFVGTTEYNSSTADFDFATEDMTLGGLRAANGDWFEGEIAEFIIVPPQPDDIINLIQQRLINRYGL